MYSSVLGRWLQEDPSGYVDGMSLYDLEESSPESHSDPTGLDSEGVVGAWDGWGGHVNPYTGDWMKHYEPPTTNSGGNPPGRPPARPHPNVPRPTPRETPPITIPVIVIVPPFIRTKFSTTQPSVCTVRVLDPKTGKPVDGVDLTLSQDDDRYVDVTWRIGPDGAGKTVSANRSDHGGISQIQIECKGWNGGAKVTITPLPPATGPSTSTTIIVDPPRPR